MKNNYKIELAKMKFKFYRAKNFHNRRNFESVGESYFRQ